MLRNDVVAPPLGTAYSVRVRPGLRPLKFVSPDDFEATNPLAIDEFPKSSALPYCFDFATRDLIFTLHNSLEQVLAEPFLHAAQRKDAQEIVRVPWEKLDSLFGPPNPEVTPTLIFSVGRCGSTLLHTLARLFTAHAFSEPDTVTSLAQSRRWRRQLSDKEADHLIWHALSPFMATTSADRTVLKLRAQANHIAPDIARLFPKAKYVFMFRRAIDWGRSLNRTFGIKPDDAAKQLVLGIRAAHRLTQSVGCAVITYEELLTAPVPVMSRVLGPDVIDRVPERVELIKATMANDSQRNTSVSRAKVRARPNEKQWLSMFETEWENAKPRRLLEKLKLEL